MPIGCLSQASERAERIIDAIEACAVMVLVLSETSNSSQYVRNEVERAMAKGKTVIPFRIHIVQPARSLEFFISIAQWIDAWHSPLISKIGALADAIAKHGYGPVQPGAPEEAPQSQYGPLELPAELPRNAARPPAHQPALVGRRAEWQTFQATWRTASLGQAQFVLIAGEDGIIGRRQVTYSRSGTPEQWKARLMEVAHALAGMAGG